MNCLSTKQKQIWPCIVQCWYMACIRYALHIDKTCNLNMQITGSNTMTDTVKGMLKSPKRPMCSWCHIDSWVIKQTIYIPTDIYSMDKFLTGKPQKKYINLPSCKSHIVSQLYATNILSKSMSSLHPWWIWDLDLSKCLVLHTVDTRPFPLLGTSAYPALIWGIPTAGSLV